MTALLDILGTTVRVVVPDPMRPEADRLLGDLPVATVGRPAAELVLEERLADGYRLVHDGAVVRERVERRHALATVVWRLNAIAAASVTHLVLHAGCVGAPAGGVVMPGRSGAGKSTLTAACVDAGCSYLSDEHAALDPGTGLLAPLPKPLDLGADALLAARDIRPGAIGDHCSPAAIVFPTFRPGGELSVRRLSPVAALVALCANTANLVPHGGLGFLWLAGMAIACPAWHLSYGDARSAVDALHGMLRADQRPAPLAPAPATPVTPGTTTVAVDDEVVVFDHRTGTVHHLNTAAAYVWMCVPDADDGRTLEDAVVGSVATGAVDRSSVRSTVERLGEIGLLPFGT